MDHIYGYLWLRRVQVRESRGTMQSGHFTCGLDVFLDRQRDAWDICNLAISTMYDSDPFLNAVYCSMLFFPSTGRFLSLL